MRTGAQFRAGGTAFGHCCFRPPRVICRRATSADREPGTLTSSPPPIACAAIRSKPPRNTASRRNSTFSGSDNSACDQSTEARKVCWRRTAVRAPPVSRRNRSCRLSRISTSDSARIRAAASSIASGIPSSRDRSPPPPPHCGRSTAKSGRDWRARSVNSSTASSSSDNDGTGQVISPTARMGSRLVANRVAAGQAPSMRPP